MVEAYVQRGLGDLPGPDIIDPLMSELQVLVLRGATIDPTVPTAETHEAFRAIAAVTKQEDDE